MADKTNIEWTRGADGKPGSTWNPVRGCSRASEGCRNCYAESVAARFSDPGAPYHGFADRARSGSKWTGKIEIIEHALTLPLRWRRPRMIFVNSMSDLFHESLPDVAIDRVFAVMALAPQHIFQVLTKRTERMRRYIELKRAKAPEWVAVFSGERVLLPYEGGIPTNVWLGVSVEDQENADERIPHLLATPAAVRFLSCEPLLGSVDLSPWLVGQEENGIDLSREPGSKVGGCIAWTPPLDWVIVGGESGPHARPMHPDWARELRDQCAAAGVPFFFKQWGEYRPLEPGEQFDGGPALRGKDAFFTQDGTAVRRVGKHAAGRLLDGREWNEMPARFA